MNKKIYALFLTLALLMQSVCAVTAEDVEDKEYDHLDKQVTTFIKGNIISSDSGSAPEQQDNYDYAYEKLIALGILTGEGNQNITSENPLTRIDFLNIIMSCMDMDYSSGTDTGFYDVPADHKYSGVINIAKNLGIVVGSGGYFRPDDAVTYIEAIAMSVRAFGYEFKADEAGGFESGYISAAIRYDLLDGVERLNNSDVIDKKNAYRLILNMVENDDIAILHHTDKGMYYAKPEYKVTMLEQYLGYAYSEGIVSTVGLSGIYSNSNESNDTVIINNISLRGDYAGCIDLLGMYSKAWYDPKRNEIIYIEALERKNTVLTINAEDVLGLSGSRYSYMEGSREKYASVTENPIVIYNGRLATADIENLYTPQHGSVTLIDNSNSGKYNVIIIDSYTDIVAGTINSEEQIIYDSYSPEITELDKSLAAAGKDASGFEKTIHLNPDKTGGIVSVVNNRNKEIYFGMISENDVLTVKQSADNKIIFVYVSSDTVSGKITSVYEDDGRKYIVVDGVEYETTEKCAKLCQNALLINTNVVLRLNKFGKAAAVEESDADADSMKYGYVIRHIVDDEVPDEPVVLIRLLQADGEIKSCRLAEKCEIDGKMKKTAKEQLEAFELGVTDDNSRVIRYVTDEENYIITIDTEYCNSDSEVKETSLKALRKITGSSIVYKGLGSFNEQVWIDTNNVIIFAVDNSAEDETKKYRVMKAGIFGNGSSYDVNAYTSKDSYEAEVIATFSSAGESVASNELAIVSGYNPVWHNEEVMYEFSPYVNGAEKKIKCDAEEFESCNIAIGDIIRYDTVDDTVLGIIKKVYDSKTKTFPDNENTESNGTSNLNSTWRDQQFLVRKGYVYDVKDGYFSFVLTNDIDRMATFDPITDLSEMVVTKMNSNVSIYKMEGNKLTVTAGSLKDLKPYADCGTDCNAVIFRSYWMQPQQFIIIEREGE